MLAVVGEAYTCKTIPTKARKKRLQRVACLGGRSQSENVFLRSRAEEQEGKGHIVPGLPELKEKKTRKGRNAQKSV